jgi:hypothetical protein
VLNRTTKVVAIATTGLLAMAGPAMAHSDDGAIDNAKATHGHDMHAQHGDGDGHLGPVDDGVDLISKLELKNVEAGGIADVAVYGDYAYLAAWGGQSCKHNGVHVVDISDVLNPEEVAFIPSKEGSYSGEGVQALSISTASFTGDILVTNNEICKDSAGFGGMNIYDVTDPAHPRPLSVGFGDYDDGKNRKKTANETHSVFAWQAGDRAYAVMVDNRELTDVDIVDITNPKKPVLVAEYDLAEQFPQIVQPDFSQVFLHDMVVKEIGGRQIMLLSYWDGGYVTVDVTDPLEPAYIGDTDFAEVDPEAAESGFVVKPEGNAHQAEFTSDNRFILGADEDFSPYALVGRNVSDGTEITASQGSDTKPLEAGDQITGEAVFVGRACDGDAAVPAGDGTQIAVVERGACFFTTKVANVEKAGGYQAVFIFNLASPGGCEGSLAMSVSGNLPTFGVAPRSQGYAIFDEPYDEDACLATTGTQLAPMQLGQTGDTLHFESYFDGWGYVHLFENEAGTMTELDTYAVDEAHDPDFASGFGDLSVHEVATSQINPNLAYLAYYAAGLRVIDISSGEIEEIGAFIDEGGNNFWGVEVFQQDGVEYVALSDRDFGLYIMKAAP